jgi:predicted enzyme related to lactoylglutathione lyase
MTAMDITIYQALLPHDDPEATLTFYRDTSASRYATTSNTAACTGSQSAPPDQPGTSIVLFPPAATPGITEDERRTIAEMMAKGTYASINLATTDVDGTFERLQAGDAEVVQEPTDQPYGLRDCAFRDPAGNLLRIQEVS